MKNPLKDFLLIVLFVFLSWLCVRPAHANNFSRTPYYSGQQSTITGFYANPSAVGSAPFIPNATAGNPQGYQASVVNGAVKLEAPTAITAGAPAGQSVSPALQASGAALAGGATLAAAASFIPTVNNPAAVISAASTFMVAGGTAASLFNPVIGVPLVAAGLALQGGLATCQVVGCSFLDGLKTQGIQFAADGVVNKVSSGATTYATTCVAGTNVITNGAGSYPSYCTAGSNAVPPIPGAVHRTGGSCALMLPVGGVSTYAGYDLTSSFFNCVLTSGSGTTQPATSAEVAAAIAAASSSANFKADMVNLGLQNGMAMIVEAQTAQSVQVASAFTQLSSVTDSLGNTVQILARNVASIAPGANASLPPVVTNSIQQVTVTNAVPTSTTTTTIVDSAAAAVAAAAGQVTQDMCVQHPDILACANIANLNDLPAVTPLTSEKNISSITPVSLGAGMAVCPPPLVLPGMFGGGVMYLDIWKYPCQFAGAIKPITIAAAGMVSIFILMGAFRNG